jgi:hypothetical protein
MPASKFTPENRTALVDHTAAGLSLADASRAALIRPKTVKSWLTRGRREASGPYAQFVADVERARAEAERARQVPLSEPELRLAVSEMAKRGSVRAARVYWEMLHSPRLAGVRTKP